MSKKWIHFDYENIDTSRLKDKSDRDLLKLMMGCKYVSDMTGYGYVAELCKRFERTICDSPDYSIELCEHGQDYDECPDCSH